MDAHHTKLKAEMVAWAKTHDVPPNRGVYFVKGPMDEIIKLEFNPEAAMAYFNTPKKGMPILIVQPHRGNETAENRSHKHAMVLTEQNYTHSNAMGLGKNNPCPPAGTTLSLSETLADFSC